MSSFNKAMDIRFIWYLVYYFIINTFEFLLNYLNILDLAKIYIEIGYALGSINLLYRKAFTKKVEYENFLLGKLSKYEKKKIEGFKKDYQELYNNYKQIKDNAKFDELKLFIEKINNEKHLLEKCGIGLGLGLESKNPKDNNMTENQLEKKLQSLMKIAKVITENWIE